jgi:hypothetical protein
MLCMCVCHILNIIYHIQSKFVVIKCQSVKSYVGYVMAPQVTCCYVITKDAVLGSAGGFHFAMPICMFLTMYYIQTVAADS